MKENNKEIQNEQFMSIGSQVGKWTKTVNCCLLSKLEKDGMAKAYPRIIPKKRKKKPRRIMKSWKK